MRRLAVAVVLGGIVTACSRVGSSRPSPVRESSVALTGGEFWRGHAEGRKDEAPRHRVRVAPFAIDTTLVTRAEFATFVGATNYVTTAEVIGFGMGAREGMEDWEWERMPHASWRRPFQEGTINVDTFLRDDAPVVLVSYEDAVAFCAHAHKRLPTEAEWEYAMRAGRPDTRYPWGDTPDPEGNFRLNFWQGESHEHNLRLDGFVYVSPVRAFPSNAWGVHDPVGNVWQWTADWYAPDAYEKASRLHPALNPQGPVEGTQKVLRGGSWWCGACVCEGNGLHYRGKAHPRAVYNNNGFRCVR